MAAPSNKELIEKAKGLQTDLDSEQGQVDSTIADKDAIISNLEKVVSDLRAGIGESDAERQELANILDSIKADIKTTIKDAPVVDEGGGGGTEGGGTEGGGTEGGDTGTGDTGTGSIGGETGTLNPQA